MRFRLDGPDIPAELIAAQEKGETIFICGAGVSRTAGLPLFRGLVEGVYRELSEDWRRYPAEREGMQVGGELHGQYDRVLRSLERRLAASNAPRNRGMRGRIRAAVRIVLAPTNVKLENHLELLKLSRDSEARSRLLTTNFDTLFERAWWDSRQERIASHAGPAMPQPKVDAFTGVLHLHGRLADERIQLGLAEETALILTSAEFGDAYLRSGWASRYVLRYRSRMHRRNGWLSGRRSSDALSTGSARGGSGTIRRFEEGICVRPSDHGARRKNYRAMGCKGCRTNSVQACGRRRPLDSL